MKAAAEFLSGKYPNARQAAEAHQVPGPNVSYYVKAWRNTEAVDAMVERLVSRDDDAAAASSEPTAEEEAVAEPVVHTATDRSCLDGVRRMSPGAGYNKSGTDEVGYKTCYKWAAAEYIAARSKAKGKQAASDAGYRAISEKVLNLTGVYISYSTIRRAVQVHESGDVADQPVASPEHRGKRSPYPRDAELNIVSWIKAMRGFKLAVFKDQVMAVANSQIIGCEAAAFWRQGVTNHWYYRFLETHGLDTGTYRPLEISRAQWTTAANMKKHYDVLQEVFLEAGIAVKNPDFDATKPYDEAIKIIHPNMLFSWDESKATLNMKEGGKSSAERVVLSDGDDRGEVVGSVGGGEASIVCGSYGDGHSIPPMTIFAAGSILPRWTDGGPNSTKTDPATGRPYPGTYAFNDTGAMKEKLTTQFMQHNVFAAMDKPPPNVRPVGIGDGYADHFNVETLDYLRGKPADLVLRPPHTRQRCDPPSPPADNNTHDSNALRRSQGEDVVGFAVLKPTLRKKRLAVLGEKIQQKKVARLTFDDYGACLKEPCEHAFSRERNIKSWDAIGVVPFTQRVYWELKQEEEAAAEAAGQADAPTWNKGAAVFPGGADDDDAAGDGDDDDDAVPTGTDRSAHNRLASADLWDKGAVTADSAHASVKAKRDAQLLKEQEKAARRQSKQQAATARQCSAAQEAQVAIARLQAGGLQLSSMSATSLAANCNAKELESLLLMANSQAKKGNKPDMAAQIVECVADIARATAPVAAVATEE